MKKILFIIAAGLTATGLFSGCSSDEGNTEDSVVAFASSTMSVKENKGLFYVPVVVTGKQNGPIEVDVEIIENSESCIKDKHFLLTSSHLIIPADKQKASLEILTVDDRVINDDRSFQLRIVKAKGASISEESKLIAITLRDNDNIPYERMAGSWTVEAINLLSESGNEPITWTMNISSVEDESDPSYGSLLTMSPWAIWDGSIPTFDEEGQTLSHPLTFHYNTSTKTATVDFSFGSVMASGIDFGTGEDGTDLSNASVKSGTQGMTGLVYSGTMVGTVSPDFDEIKFNLPVYGLIFTKTDRPYQFFFGLDKITMKLNVK